MYARIYAHARMQTHAHKFTLTIINTGFLMALTPYLYTFSINSLYRELVLVHEVNGISGITKAVNFDSK